jgi:hypothetical protein
MTPPNPLLKFPTDISQTEEEQTKYLPEKYMLGILLKHAHLNFILLKQIHSDKTVLQILLPSTVN